MHAFNETHPEFKGFSDYYARELAGFLNQGEELRSSALNKTKIAALFLIIIAILVAYIAWERTRNPGIVFLPIVVGCGIIVSVYSHYMKGIKACLLYTSPSPRDATLSRMPSSA